MTILCNVAITQGSYRMLYACSAQIPKNQEFVLVVVPCLLYEGGRGPQFYSQIDNLKSCSISCNQSSVLWIIIDSSFSANVMERCNENITYTGTIP